METERAEDPRRFRTIDLTVNGRRRRLEVATTWTLNDVLRNVLDLTGTKRACDYGGCGSCTVLINGLDAYSCVTLAVEAEGKDIQTIEALASGAAPHPLQKHFALLYAAQCGWCTPGMIMAAKALLDRSLDPSDDEIRAALSGVLCRCTGYTSVVEAVRAAGRELRRGPK
jgi:aerobic-type carbon monoxide dehydrogenase small subunit (CoxS/CutS family)